MNTALVILFVLVITSAMLCCALTLAWLHFGRQPHALTWAGAYAGGALQWMLNAAMLAFAPGNKVLIMLGTVLLLATSSLIAIGSRQRAGLPPRFGRFATAITAASIAIALTITVFPYFGLRVFIANIFITAMTLFAVAAMRSVTRKARPPEIAFIVMLSIFGLYQVLLACMGLAIGVEGDPKEIDLYRSVLVLGLPPIHIGTGIAALFLLAGDLADSVRALVTRDPMTGSLNRRGLEQAAIGAIANARRHGRPLVAVVGDIDRFKAINDRFGHGAGDRALIAFADHVHASVREEDLLGRLGGDEFCVVLIDTTLGAAVELIERTGREVAQLEIGGTPGLTMTASFGVAAFDPADVGFGDMLHRADLALLEAKLAGRNRVVVAPPPQCELSEKAVR